MHHAIVFRSTAVAAAVALTLSACGSANNGDGAGTFGTAARNFMGAVGNGLESLAQPLTGGAGTASQGSVLGDSAGQAGVETGATANSAAPSHRPLVYGTVSDIQAELLVRGYDPGPLDGRYGPSTERAIRRYQQDHGLEPTGEASPALLEHMQSS